MLEYTVMRNYYPAGAEHPTEQLNAAAREGWRLVSTVNLRSDFPGMLFIMEREKSD